VTHSSQLEFLWTWYILIVVVADLDTRPASITLFQLPWLLFVAIHSCSDHLGTSHCLALLSFISLSRSSYVSSCDVFRSVSHSFMLPCLAHL